MRNSKNPFWRSIGETAEMLVALLDFVADIFSILHH